MNSEDDDDDDNHYNNNELIKRWDKMKHPGWSPRVAFRAFLC